MHLQLPRFLVCDIVSSEFEIAYSDNRMLNVACQAFREHKLFDPLCEPGTADLTADVDFKYISQCVAEKGIILVWESVLDAV